MNEIIPIDQCWCGSKKLHVFSGHYNRCEECNTLLVKERMPDDFYRVSDDAASFYGKDYWLKHVKEDYGFPDVIERSRNDLPERCLYWIRDILRYKLPPAKTLELGCAHGGLVYLMKLAGYDATGTEMSSWICEYAGKTFNVPMLCGRIEDLDIPPKSLDIVIFMDVIEHMTDPVGGLKLIAGSLTDDGLAVIQTPCWRETDKSYGQMKEEKSIFMDQLKEQEHLYLFNEDSLKRILRETGFPHIAVEKQIFPYDIFVFAGKQPLKKSDEQRISAELQKTPEKRVVLALLDVFSRTEKITQSLNACEADRTNRLNAMHQLTSQVHQLNAQVEQLNARLETSEADRAARMDIINRVNAELEVCEKDRAARLDVINALDAQVKELQRKYGRPGE